MYCFGVLSRQLFDEGFHNNGIPHNSLKAVKSNFLKNEHQPDLCRKACNDATLGLSGNPKGPWMWEGKNILTNQET
jgi:hypothetical protein